MGIKHLALLTCVALFADAARAQTAEQAFTPQVGQEGKDVVWVPTPDILVQRMLDLAKLTPQDFVVDLGSGDGRMIIAAAKRGARALGVEYNPKMVELSKRSAADAGVGDKAQFVQGDMFEADFSQANVLALFLLPDNLNRLRPKFLELKPGTRIVSNTFEIDGWQPDAVESLEASTCQGWCSALLWIVPAKVEGTWRLPDGTLVLKQAFQMVSGTLRIGSNLTTIANGRLRGDEITFSAGDGEYTGRVKGDSIEGVVTSGGRKDTWTANRLP
jgi:precorrin-6B methylase 2